MVKSLPWQLRISYIIATKGFLNLNGFGFKFKVCPIAIRGVTRALIGGGGGVYIHIFVFCPTDFF